MEKQDFANKKAQAAQGKQYGDSLNYILISQGGAMAELQQSVGTANLQFENMTEDEYKRAMAKKRFR